MKNIVFLVLFLIFKINISVAENGNLAAEAVNNFGIEIYKKLSEKPANLCISPFSIQNALAMTFAGANNGTKDEMAAVLRYDKTDISLHQSFAALNKELKEITEKTTALSQYNKRFSPEVSDPVKINIANKLFGMKGFSFLEEFISLLKDIYQAPLEEIDFSDSNFATNYINTWVEKETFNKIKNLIPKGALNEVTRLVLVNAIYIKAPWDDKFNKNLTKSMAFYLKEGQEKESLMMNRLDDFGYAKKEGFSMVSIPYFGSDLQFLIIVPDKIEGLSAVERSLTPDIFSESKKLPESKVKLFLPKFKIESDGIFLSEILKTMGMKKAFDIPAGSADFSKMALRKPNDYLAISEIIHKTFFALDEEGTEAAAATAVIMLGRSAMPLGTPIPPVEVKADRPFFFAIQHKQSGALLFMGRVVNP